MKSVKDRADGLRDFSKRELIALQFAVGLVTVRDRDKNSSNAEVMRDAFAFADAFLNRKNRTGPTKIEFYKGPRRRSD